MRPKGILKVESKCSSPLYAFNKILLKVNQTIKEIGEREGLEVEQRQKKQCGFIKIEKTLD